MKNTELKMQLNVDELPLAALHKVATIHTRTHIMAVLSVSYCSFA